ncbi:MAG TPA: VWA domain-containing protein [Blastocatellia bacterium]|nr:VWA domain-containing protein [Blastocatellia bacterium]
MLNQGGSTGPTIEATVLFCRALRERGLAVTSSEAIDAVKTLSLVDRADRREVFLSLKSILTSRLEDFPIFEELFDAFWGRQGEPLETRKLVETPRDPNKEGQGRLSSSTHRPRGLPYLLENWLPPESADSESIEVPVASDVESSAEMDVGLFGTDELEEIGRLSRRIARRLAANPSRRWRPVRRGPRVHMRKTLRQSLKTGGEIIELLFKQRKQNKTRLVVICDVSGSMDLYSRLLLQFVFGLQNSFARVETFIFSTALERITGYLKEASYARALERLAANVRGWSGGTLIGQSIAAFNSDWARLADRRTIVIILSDGWDTGEPEELASSLATLKRRAGRLIWLNPLLGSATYRPLTRGMQAALPHIDVFASAHNFDSLRALERHLVL